jgi:hypothetical protein
MKKNWEVFREGMVKNKRFGYGNFWPGLTRKVSNGEADVAL